MNRRGFLSLSAAAATVRPTLLWTDDELFIITSNPKVDVARSYQRHSGDYALFVSEAMSLARAELGEIADLTGVAMIVHHGREPKYMWCRCNAWVPTAALKKYDLTGYGMSITGLYGQRFI